MKKCSLLLFLAITTLFISCEKESTNENVVDQESIIGTWALKGYDVENGKTSATIEGVPIASDFTITGKNFDTEVVFSDNPKTFMGEGSFTAVITTTYEGESNVAEKQINNFIGSGEWLVENSTLTANSNGIEIAYKITSLDAQTLVLEQELTYAQNVMGTIITTSGTYVYTLERK